MKYITYSQKGGRSGHKLKDIMTSFIISFFNDEINVVSHKSWKRQNILNHINIKKIENIDSSKILRIQNKIKKWNGISYSEFLRILNQINKTKPNTVIVISKVTRIHPYQLHNWYTSDQIETDYFTQNFIPLIRKFYYGNNKPKLNNVFSIHIRRGDIARGQIKEGWDMKFYKNIILFVKKHIKIPIKIYTENYNYKDLLPLKKIKDVVLNVGGPKQLKSDLNNMICSRYLLLSSSSFSTWMAYISTGHIFIPDKLKIKHFDHIKLPENIHYIRDLPKIINKKLDVSVEEKNIISSNVGIIDIVPIDKSIIDVESDNIDDQNKTE